MAFLPRRISKIHLLGAVFIIFFLILLYTHSSWRWKDYNEPHEAHHNIKGPVPPEAVQQELHEEKEDPPPQAKINNVTEAVELVPYNRDNWAPPNYDVHVFYYSWYGNPAHDKTWHHWNHRFLPHWDNQKAMRFPSGRHIPPDDIGANYFPQLGAYSSRDPEIIDRHMYEIRKARIGVVAVSWYPTGHADDEGEPPDRLMPAILRAADKYDLKVAFHIEPFENRIAETISAAVKYIIDKYGSHNAFYRKTRAGRELPLFYMYDSYQVKGNEWRKLFSPLESQTLRQTEYDGIFIGLAVEAAHLDQNYNSGFDGMYTYFASDTFVFGSMPSNWNRISKYCKGRELLFIPSVGPGYIDTEVRPWNSVNTKDRSNGVYYRKNFKMALTTLPDIVSITSFNEWHEGTQIEAAIPHERGYGKKYLDYGGPASMYMDLTRNLIESMPSTIRT